MSAAKTQSSFISPQPPQHFEAFDAAKEEPLPVSVEVLGGRGCPLRCPHSTDKRRILATADDRSPSLFLVSDLLFPALVGMLRTPAAATRDNSKSSARKGVWVQIPPGALCRSCEFATHPASLMRRLGRR